MNLLQMSISAGMLIAVIWLLRRVGRRLFPAGFLFALWFVAAVRMLLPVSLPIQLPVFSLESALENGGNMGAHLDFQETGRDDAESREEMAAGAYDRISWWCTLIWADVALALLFSGAVAYIRQLLRINESMPLEGNQFLEEWKASHPVGRNVRFLYFDRIASPVTCGIINPGIVFPKEMDLDDRKSLEHVLRHEYVHIRRFDNLWKILVFAAVCIHWFNPMAWVMWYCFNRDMELSCDERAVRGMDRKGRIAYAMTLLRFAEKGRRVSLLYNGFGKSPVKERIMVLMRGRKRNKIGIVCSILVMTLSMTVFASPKEGIQGRSGETGEESPARMLYETPQFGEYQELGLYYIAGTDVITYNSTGVGYFIDEYAPGVFNQMNDLAGSICLKAERDSAGKLTGFWEVERTDYLKQASDADRRRAQGRGFIKEYGQYGLSLDQDTGYLSYNGKLVEAIRDTGGCGTYVNSAFTAGEDTTCLLMVRGEDGSLEQIREMDSKQMSEVLEQSMGVYRDSDGWKGKSEM